MYVSSFSSFKNIWFSSTGCSLHLEVQHKVAMGKKNDLNLGSTSDIIWPSAALSFLHFPAQQENMGV